MTLTERFQQLEEMDFNDKSKKEIMEGLVIGNILTISKQEQEQNKFISNFEICCELLIKNAKMYKRRIVTKSEYNLRRNTIEKIMF